jgi:hypothetical protein
MLNAPKITGRVGGGGCHGRAPEASVERRAVARDRSTISSLPDDEVLSQRLRMKSKAYTSGAILGGHVAVDGQTREIRRQPRWPSLPR